MPPRDLRLLLAAMLVFAVGSAACLAQSNVRYENERMYVDGEPFFYYGFIWYYPCTPLEMLKEYHYNAVDANGRGGRLQEYDRAARAGIHLMDSSVQEWIPKHPAFLAWFLLDDAAGEQDAKLVRERVERVRTVDKTHPTLVDLNGRTIESDKLFVDTIDIYAPYAYPIPTKSYQWYFHDFLDHLRDGVGRKYMWSAFQCSGIYSFHGHMGFTSRDMHMYPTPGQFRLLCWGAVAHGMRGFMFWPISGLLPPQADNGDRTAEALIMAHELEIIGGDIIEGDEVRDGVTADCQDIDLGRIDLADSTIIIASVVRDKYQWAMDEATATATITLPRPKQLHGTLTAYRFGFPCIADLDMQADAGNLTIPAVSVDVTQVIVIQEARGPREQYQRELAKRLPEVAAHTQMLLEYLHAKMQHVHARLHALEVELDSADEHYAQATQLKAASEQAFVNDDFASAFGLARRAQQHYRAMLYDYREYAESLLDSAPPGVSHLLMMPYTLPRFFAAFDHTAVTTQSAH